ncbi:MAG: hypothetical protein R6U98_24855, partial [Pirellulaceae bacterium]
MMIQVARSKAADNGADRSALKPENAACVDISRGTSTNCPGPRAICGPAARFVSGGGDVRGSRTGMVGETMTNRHSEMDPVPPHGITADMGDLTRDIVSLAELQFQLFRDDCRHGLHKLLISVALLVVAAMVA